MIADNPGEAIESFISTIVAMLVIGEIFDGEGEAVRVERSLRFFYKL